MGVQCVARSHAQHCANGCRSLKVDGERTTAALLLLETVAHCSAACTEASIIVAYVYRHVTCNIVQPFTVSHGRQLLRTAAADRLLLVVQVQPLASN